MIRHHKHAFLAQAQALGFHGGTGHLKRFSCPDHMGQQRVATVKNVRDGVPLVFSQADFRVHAGESDVLPIVFTGPDGIEQFVVLGDQGFPAARFFPYPFAESVLDGLLLLLGQGGFLLVQDTLFFPVRVLDGVIDTHVSQVQGVLQDSDAVSPIRAIGQVHRHVVIGKRVFVGDMPFGSVFGKLHLNGAALIKRDFKQFLHKLLDVFFSYPGRPQTHVDFRSLQILGLSFFQGLHIRNENGRNIRRCPRFPQLFPHVAGKVLIRRHIPGLSLIVHRRGEPEDHTGQIGGDFIFGLVCQLCHVWQIHAGFFRNGNSQGFHRRVHMIHGALLPDRPLGEHIRFSGQLPVFIEDFQGTKQIVRRIGPEYLGIGAAVDQPVFFGISVIELIQFRLQRMNGIVAVFFQLRVHEPMHTIPQLHHALDTLLCGSVQFRPHHDGVFAVVNLIFYNGVGIILYVWGSRDAFLDFLSFLQIRGLYRVIFTCNMLYGLGKLLG